MLSIKKIREDFKLVQAAINKRNVTIDFDQIIKHDLDRKTFRSKGDELKKMRNDLSKEIGILKKNKEPADELMEQVQDIAVKIKSFDDKAMMLEKMLQDLMLSIPNIPHSSVKVGNSEEDNEVVRVVGNKPTFDFEPKPHWEIGENLDILDFKRGAKIAGARFTLYKKAGARLERALINLMLDTHTSKHGYSEMLPPFMANRKALTGTGQLPKFEDDLFKMSEDDYFLIPTAEVPLTNIHADEVLNKKQFPIYYTAYTPCFRREAGSYGKDVRGLIRQHQFNKVELVKFVLPENSYDELEKLLNNAEEILKLLGLHYRVVNLCSGDLGFSSAKTYDIEVWLPGQDCFREISSCSNFEDFQARRAKIRFKKEGEKPELVHTINGSGLAVGRTVVAILENYQQADGSVVIPEKLRVYMGGLEKIEL